MSLETMWPLTVAWYGDRLDTDYRPASPERVQEILARSGLVSDFWRFA